MIIDVHTHIGQPPSDDRKLTSREKLRMLLKETGSGKVDRILILPMYKAENQCAPTVEEALKLTAGIKNVSVAGTIDVLHYGKKIWTSWGNGSGKKRLSG